ncbi:MAG: DUF1911 domain-containing protein [Microbacteriaceae bacterium]
MLFGSRRVEVVVTAPRDTRQDAAYWARAVRERDRQVVDIDRHYRKARPKNYPSASQWAWALELPWITKVNAMRAHYSAGSALVRVAELVEPAMDGWERWMDVTDEIEGPRYVPWTYRYEDVTSTPVNVLDTLSFAALLRPELVPRGIGLLGRMGGDATVERLLGVPGAGGATPKPVDRLVAVLDAPVGERPKALARYLSGWYGAHRRTAWYGTDRAAPQSWNYPGYWAVEAAVAAVRLDIDDSRIRSEYYPRELAEHARR